MSGGAEWLLKDSGCRLELTIQKLGLICFLMFVDKLCEGRKLRLSYHSGTIVQVSCLHPIVLVVLGWFHSLLCALLSSLYSLCFSFPSSPRYETNSVRIQSCGHIE